MIWPRQLDEVKFSSLSVATQSASQAGGAQVQRRYAGASCPSGVGDINYIWRVTANRGRGQVVTPIDV